MEAQLRFMADQGVDVIITSGGLGPTADDLTWRSWRGSPGASWSSTRRSRSGSRTSCRPLMKRCRNLDPDAVRAANRKQAMVPEGA